MSAQSLEDGLARVRADLLADDRLVRAVASGRRKQAAPDWRRVELRWVDLSAGRQLQVVRYDATQAHTSNHPVGDAAAAEVDRLLADPFGNWTVTTTEHELALRVTKKGQAMVHVRAAGVCRGDLMQRRDRHDHDACE